MLELSLPKSQSIRPSEERYAAGQKSRTFCYLNLDSIIHSRLNFKNQRSQGNQAGFVTVNIKKEIWTVTE